MLRQTTTTRAGAVEHTVIDTIHTDECQCPSCSPHIHPIQAITDAPPVATGGYVAPRDDLPRFGEIPLESLATLAKPVNDDTNPKDRLGVKKVPLSLVPMVAIIYEALAFAEGARKYGEFNWRRKKVRRRVYLEAILRHTIAALAGEDIDIDSGLPHEAKIRACCAIILDAKECGALVDDRYEKDGAAALINRLTAGDYHDAATKLTRTPARTLDELNQQESS